MNANNTLSYGTLEPNSYTTRELVEQCVEGNLREAIQSKSSHMYVAKCSCIRPLAAMLLMSIGANAGPKRFWVEWVCPNLTTNPIRSDSDWSESK